MRFSTTNTGHSRKTKDREVLSFFTVAPASRFESPCESGTLTWAVLLGIDAHEAFLWAENAGGLGPYCIRFYLPRYAGTRCAARLAIYFPSKFASTGRLVALLTPFKFRCATDLPSLPSTTLPVPSSPPRESPLISRSISCCDSS